MPADSASRVSSRWVLGRTGWMSTTMATLDLFVANGHIIDNIADFRDNIAYAQRNQIYRNDGYSFTDIGPVSGLNRATVSRGSVAADLDGDGRIDFVVSNNGGAAEVLMNRTAVDPGVELVLRGTAAARWPAGTRVTATNAVGVQLRELRAGSSYASSGPRSLHFGTAGAGDLSFVVRWPDGTEDTLPPLPAGTRALVVQGKGVVARR